MVKSTHAPRDAVKLPARLKTFLLLKMQYSSLLFYVSNLGYSLFEYQSFSLIFTNGFSLMNRVLGVLIIMIWSFVHK